MKNSRLVYSTDPKDAQVCPKCKELMPECRCPPEADLKSHKFVAKLRIEKSGRNGKTVTVVADLPKNEIFLKELTREIKTKCGTGGTYDMSGREGLVEIQGDKRPQIRELFVKKNYQFKG